MNIRSTVVAILSVAVIGYAPAAFSGCCQIFVAAQGGFLFTGCTDGVDLQECESPSVWESRSCCGSPAVAACIQRGFITCPENASNSTSDQIEKDPLVFDGNVFATGGNSENRWLVDAYEAPAGN